MAKRDQNSPPPPYYPITVHSLPPIKSYDEAVYGVGPGLTPPNQPHYIPQYPSPTVAPQVPHSGLPPSHKRKRCCENNAQCYGATGGVLLVLALLALAIWLGVCYGTKMAASSMLSDADDFNDHSGFHTYDTCPNNTVYCDGKKDCEQGSDEANCVRFAEDNLLQVRTSEDGRFLPVCYRGWDESYAQQTCAQLGFRRYSVTKAIKSPLTSTGLALSQRKPLPIQSLVKVSSSCPDQEIISLQCVACGKQKSTSRIIGGSNAKRGQWPWQLSLHFRQSHICGAVLISSDFVLTAAHCFPSEQYMAPNSWKVYGGVVSLNNLPKPYLVERIILNENYNNKTNDLDVALIKLKKPVAFNNIVHPACLPKTGQKFPEGTKCWTSGFGSTVAGSGVVSNDLKEVTVNIIGTQQCNGARVYGGHVSKNMLCAGDLDGGKDSCQGDSGGPLVCQSDNTWYLAGITSWGAGCGQKNKPGVYTDVRSVLPWIYRKMQQMTP